MINMVSIHDYESADQVPPSLDTLSRLGAVTHVVALEASLGYIAKPCFKQQQKNSWAWCFMPIILASQEVEVRG